MTGTTLTDNSPALLQATKPDDRLLNPYRYPITDDARKLLAAFCAEADAQQQAHKPRMRQRKPTDMATFRATVSAVMSDLVRQCVEGETKGVSLSRSNEWPPVRYQSPIHNKMLPGVLDALSEQGLGYVRQTTGQWGFEGEGHLTSLLPTTKLQDVVRAAGLSYDAIGGGRGGEVLHLQGPPPKFGRASLIGYDETPETSALRHQMTKVNDWLTTAELSVDEDLLSATDQFPDLGDRWLVRRFTQGTFEAGGRLWGGYWQGMKKELRRRALLINDEPAVELDFGQAGARILYGMAGVQVPDLDLYAVPGFEKHRDGIKAAMASMTFASRRLVRFPPDMKAKFGKTHTMNKVVEAVEDHHRPIIDFFLVGAGHRAQRIESDILIETLVRLVDLGVAALPIHDAVMVSRRSASMVGKVMLDVFREKAAVEGQLSSYPVGLIKQHAGVEGG
jgi:hypothetical protein